MQYGIRTALKRRPAAQDGMHTWMEVYLDTAEEFAAKLEQAVAEQVQFTRPLITGKRHVEHFLDLIAMCLIVFAWQVIPNMPLLAAGNRDEFYDRPASPADWWHDHPQIYAGRDLQGGGTWMGVTRDRDALPPSRIFERHRKCAPMHRHAAIWF